MRIENRIAITLALLSTAGIASQKENIAKSLEEAIKNKYEISISFDSVAVNQNPSEKTKRNGNQTEWNAWGTTSTAKISKYIGLYEKGKLVDFWLDIYADTINDPNLAKLKSKSRYIQRLININDSLSAVVQKQEVQRLLKNQRAIKFEISSKIKEHKKIKSVVIDSISLQSSTCTDTLPECWRRINERTYLVYAIVNGGLAGKYTAFEKKGKITDCEWDEVGSENDPYLQEIIDSIYAAAQIKGQKYFKSHKAEIDAKIKKCLKENANDPSSVQIAKTFFVKSNLTDATYNVVFRAKNGFGALVIGAKSVTIEGNTCTDLSDIDLDSDDESSDEE